MIAAVVAAISSVLALLKSLQWDAAKMIRLGKACHGTSA
jgi:hypothetical protein